MHTINMLSLTFLEPADDMKGRNIASKIVSQRQEDKLAGVATETFSGLRIKLVLPLSCYENISSSLLMIYHRNPLVSSEQMKKRMMGVKMIRMKMLSSRLKNANEEGNWVTIGVIVDKLPPRCVYRYIRMCNPQHIPLDFGFVYS